MAEFCTCGWGKDLKDLHRSKDYIIKLQDQKIQELELEIQQTRKETKKVFDEANFVREKIENMTISNVSDRVKGVDMLPRRVFFGMEQVIDRRILKHGVEEYFGPVEKLNILSTQKSGFITFESPNSYFNAIDTDTVHIEGIRVYFSKFSSRSRSLSFLKTVEGLERYNTMNDTETASTKVYNNMPRIVFILGVFLIPILALVSSSLAFPTAQDTLSNTPIITISGINNKENSEFSNTTESGNSGISNSSLNAKDPILSSTEVLDSNGQKLKNDLVTGAPTALYDQGNQYRESAVRGQDYAQFYMVTISGLSAASISQCSNLYMMYRILSRPDWYDSWNHRFPFYLAIQDTFFNLNMISEWIEIISTQNFPTKLVCKFQGGFLNFAIAWNIMLVTCTAITAYIKVYRERQVEFGRFDWKFHFVCLTAPCLIIGAGILSDAYGTSTYWCQINVASLSGRINMLALSGIVIACTFVTAYCYIKVITKIRASFAKLQSMRSNTIPTNPIEFQDRCSAYSMTDVGQNSMADSNNKRFSEFYQAMNNRKNSVTTLRGNNNGGPSNMMAMPHDHSFGWEDEAIGKMFSYILVFVCQWGPGVLAYILIFNGCNNIISNTMMVLFVHLGGFFNAIVYLRQHGYFTPRIRPDNPANSSDSSINIGTATLNTSSSSFQDSSKNTKVPSNRKSLCVPGTNNSSRDIVARSRSREHSSTDDARSIFTVEEIEL
ncbi:11315_t:CDS:2 [Ambispora gerdemannii]|uniref:11315_t:CDS:1 n=1 Tax=Ambispora gerdemannii TaxID=144530 RepID=A0A9N8Z2X2_9GLOM|nr:11315_t:CDS:2 [Ambispora gerdemannii]